MVTIHDTKNQVNYDPILISVGTWGEGVQIGKLLLLDQKYSIEQFDTKTAIGYVIINFVDFSE